MQFELGPPRAAGLSAIHHHALPRGVVIAMRCSDIPDTQP
jgi:hypothetical protein